MDPDLIDLVVRSLTCGLSNCVEWISDREASRVRSDPSNRGLTPEGIKRLLCEYVRVNGPNCVEQFRETRDRWKEKREYWYRIIVPLDDFPHGLFVEMELLDEDPDVPVVALLNAHPGT